MDIQMPILDGLAATKQIRAFEQETKRSRGKPIIGISGNSQPQDLQAAMAAGMNKYLTKPYSHLVIPKLIAEYCTEITVVPTSPGAATSNACSSGAAAGWTHPTGVTESEASPAGAAAGWIFPTGSAAGWATSHTSRPPRDFSYAIEIMDECKVSKEARSLLG